MIFALIPAAGHSTRMGRPKLTLPLGDRTILERVIGAFHAAGVGHVLVVAGPHVPELPPLARAAGAAVCELPSETPDMRATVEAGLAWIESHYDMREDDSWLLCPADHPCLDAAIVAGLVTARLRHPECSIVIPTFEGRRGHPTLISWKHTGGIRALPSGVGLNTYLRQHSSVTLELSASSSSVLLDLDTPEDMQR